MAYSTTNLYPEDLNGTNPLNLIKNEVQSLQVPGPKDFYFIIPHAAPFFVDSLKVFNNANGTQYVEGKDYLVGHRFIEAMDSIGRPIAGSIRFMRRDITGQVKLEYRTIGGQWGFSDAAIMAELARKQLNPLIRSWGDIDVLPYSFPPLVHDQSLDTIVGSEDLQASLERIADVMEATASGTTQSHLTDYNNPHRVTKAQVGLSLVPNYAMANDTQATAATLANLFISPRGVLLAIQEHALKPLNAHIADQTNPHRVTKTQVGLSNVPNYPAATAAQAVDPTNTTTLLTPYTASLLVQKLQNDPRLDQLILDFNEHITANNPHGITPSMIGTYTASEIDQKIAAGGSGSGGNADTFGGETPAQWVAKFPSNADINQMLKETADIYQAKGTTIIQVDMSDPVTPAIIAQRNARKISWAFGAYAAYAIYNSYGQAKIISSTETKVGGAFPTDTIANGANKWASDLNANYYIESNGAVTAWGSAIVPIPAVNKPGGSFLPANAVSGVWASKDYIWLQKSSNNELARYNRSGAKTVEIAKDVVEAFVGNGMVDPRPIGLAEVGATPSAVTLQAFGDASWVTAINSAVAGWGAQKFHDCRIASEYVNFITYTGTVPAAGAADNRVFYLRLYKINFGASITLTEVTNTIDIKNHTTGEVVKANTIRGVTSLAGSYTHFVFAKPLPNSELCDLLSFGDNSQGQLEMLPTSAPFLSIAAGYQYTITINQQNFVEFWGNSPDNSLFYRGGAFID